MNKNVSNVIKGLLVAAVLGLSGCGGGGGGSDSTPLTVANTAPVASAGTTQNIGKGNLVRLDGSGSSDANGDSLSYSWSLTSKPNGSNAALSGATEAKPSFTPDVAGTYVFNLVVNDGKVNSTVATVSVICSPTTYTTYTYAGPIYTDYFGTYFQGHISINIMVPPGVTLSSNSQTNFANGVAFSMSDGFTTLSSTTGDPSLTHIAINSVNSSGIPTKWDIAVGNNGAPRLTSRYSGLNSWQDQTQSVFPSTAQVCSANPNKTEPGTFTVQNSPNTYSISGSVTSGGSPLSGVTVTLTGSVATSKITDSNGNFMFSGVANGSYTLRPSKSGYSFSPSSTSVTVNGANLTGKNFAGTTGTAYILSGRVATSAGSGISGVTLSSGGTTAVTDTNGNYSFFGATNGSYTITPSLSGYTFSPTSIAVTVNSADATGKNFTGTATPVTSTISLSITDACNDSYRIDYKFFDETNNLLWPSAAETYYTSHYNTKYTSNLACTPGANICFGGNTGNTYWGVSVNNTESCASCCITCSEGATYSWDLTCGGSSSGGSGGGSGNGGSGCSANDTTCLINYCANNYPAKMFWLNLESSLSSAGYPSQKPLYCADAATKQCFIDGGLYSGGVGANGQSTSVSLSSLINLRDIALADANSLNSNAISIGGYTIPAKCWSNLPTPGTSGSPAISP